MKKEGSFRVNVTWIALGLALVALAVSVGHWIALVAVIVIAIWMILEFLLPRIFVDPLPVIPLHIDERHIGVFIITLLVLLAWWVS